MAAEFGNATLWMKLVMLLVSGGFTMHLFSMDVAEGWPAYQIQTCRNNGSCYDNTNAVQAVQGLEVIGFLLLLISLFLALGLVLLDELRGNRKALVVLFLASFLSGMCIISGIGVYEGTTNNYGAGWDYQKVDDSEFASTIGVTAGISAMIGGMFCLFELLRCH